MRCVALPLIILALPEVLAFKSWIVKHPLKKGREECYGCSRICRQVTHRQVLVLACMSTGHRVKPCGSALVDSFSFLMFSLNSIRFPFSFYLWSWPAVHTSLTGVWGKLGEGCGQGEESKWLSRPLLNSPTGIFQIKPPWRLEYTRIIYGFLPFLPILC